MNTQFIVAKYIPDLKRMEPRNIGVVVWHKGATRARFIGEDADTGELVSSPRRAGVKDVANYRHWVESWRMMLAKPSIEADRGIIVEKSSPEFLSSLCKWFRGNYVLVSGGQVPDEISVAELPALTNYLFGEIVAASEDAEAKAREYDRLKVESNKLMKVTGIASRHDFTRDSPAWYKIHDVLRYVNFSYALGEAAKPDVVYHRVLLANQKSFDSEFLHIDWFLKSRKFDPRHFAALIASSGKESKEQTDNRTLLERMDVRVVNISDEKAASQELVDIASANGNK